MGNMELVALGVEREAASSTYKEKHKGGNWSPSNWTDSQQRTGKQ